MWRLPGREAGTESHKPEKKNLDNIINMQETMEEGNKVSKSNNKLN
jgi:hypothetical protein